MAEIELGKPMVFRIFDCLGGNVLSYHEHAGVGGCLAIGSALSATTTAYLAQSGGSVKSFLV